LVFARVLAFGEVPGTQHMGNMKLTPKAASKFARLAGQRKNISWSLPHARAPEHIKSAAKLAVRQHFQALDLESIPFIKKGGCGERLSAKKLGMKPKKMAKFVQQTVVVSKSAEHPGRESYSVPGAGTTQTLKDDGLSETGTVDGEKPFVTVLKDGYFEVGCFTDGMNEFGDKFGDEKDKYGKMVGDTSIVRYEEIILEERQKAMTPTICFEFCRSLPDMVFFGITNGRNCYCAPYYKPAAGDDKKCDSPCEGDTTVMCGNQKKSTIWEMHLCADTAQDLEEAMTASKEALDFFFEQAVLTVDLGKKLTAAGADLQKTGGLAGSPTAADMGLKAKQSTKVLTQGYQNGFKTYNKLLAAYKIGEDLKTEDAVLVLPKPQKFPQDKPIGTARTLVTCNEEDVIRIQNDILEELTPEQICLTPTIVCAYTILEIYGSKLKPGDSVLLNAAHLHSSGASLIQLCKLLKLKPLCLLPLPGALAEFGDPSSVSVVPLLP